MMNYKGKLIRITALRDISEKVKAQRELNLHKSHLEEEIKKRTKEMQRIINLMAGRETRMAELKNAIKILRRQLKELGHEPAADDPLKTKD